MDLLLFRGTLSKLTLSGIKSSREEDGKVGKELMETSSSSLLLVPMYLSMYYTPFYDYLLLPTLPNTTRTYPYRVP